MPAKGWKQLLRLRGHESPIGRFSWSSQGGALATPGMDGRLVLWDTSNGDVIANRDLRRTIVASHWSPTDDTVAIVVSSESFNLGGDDEMEAMYSTYGIEDAALQAFEEGDIDGFGHDEGPAYVRLVDASSALQLGTLGSSSARSRPVDVHWVSDNQLLTASGDGVAVWQARGGHFLGYLESASDDSYSGVSASADAGVIAAAQSDGWIRLWEANAGALITSLRSDEVALSCITLAARSQRLAVGSTSGGVEIWEGLGADSELRTLEGHTGGVTAVSFSADGKLLASASLDGSVKVWDTSTWTLLSELVDQSMVDIPMHTAFSPTKAVLAATAEGGQAVRLWQLDVPLMAARQKRPTTVVYANAKVVLLGDTGVGKTGLGLVLCQETFRPTDSTHTRNVWMLTSVATDGDAAERHEVYLWDLAGQTGYRLLHQLHLSDVAVALVVFDARSEVDPLSGVRYWARALTQAEHQRQAGPGGIARILVAARMDRGGAKIGDQELREVRQQFGFTRYIATSAKEGLGVQSLRENIEDAINWDLLPKVSSTKLFEAIRTFLRHKRETDLVLAREAELRVEFVSTGAAGLGDVEAEFRICVERAQSRGLVRRLSFGDLVLLQPEVLDAYAAAVLHAAAADPDALGAIRESDVRAGAFAIPQEHRLKDENAERLLLIATVEDLLYHEVALREDSGDGPFLVFPSQVTRHFSPDVALTPYSHFQFD